MTRTINQKQALRAVAQAGTRHPLIRFSLNYKAIIMEKAFRMEMRLVVEMKGKQEQAVMVVVAPQTGAAAVVVAVIPAAAAVQATMPVMPAGMAAAAALTIILLTAHRMKILPTALTETGRYLLNMTSQRPAAPQQLPAQTTCVWVLQLI